MNQALYDNLTDAQCSEELRARCALLAACGQTAQMVALLRGHRKELLQQIQHSKKRWIAWII